MKKCHLLTICILLLLGATALAQNVTEPQALEKARKFMKGKQFVVNRSQRRAPNKTGETKPLYVFNVQNNGGFVIVSGDDRTEEILAYSDKGNIDLDNLPDNMKAWLGVYEQEIKSVAGKDVKRTPRRTVAHDAIAPLLTCQWGQGAPYNAQCPVCNDEHCVTGCVATAMAQLMYYHRWPENVGAMDSYYNYMWGVTVPELSSTTFNWSQMKDNYSQNEIADEVAKLMRYCGQAMGTLYGPDDSAVSTSIDLREILTDVFDFDPSLTVENRNAFTAQSWDELIYSELALSRPVLYGAFTPMQKGHVFICDGYSDGYFHINWGWNGDYDGYFLLSILNTENAEDYYSEGQEAYIRIKKNVNSGAGEIFTDGCFVYKVLDEDKLWLFRMSDYYDDCPHWDERAYDRKSPLVVPSIVTHNNKQYTVTELGGYEFNVYWEESGYWNEPIETSPTLVMPESLERIHGGMIIQGYEDIVLTIPRNVKYIDAGALFSGTNSFRTILVDDNNQFFKSVNGVVYTKDGKTIFQYPNGRRDKEYVVQEGVETIMGEAFFANQWIEKITLPKSVRGEIGEYAFCDCYALTSINLPEGITSLGPMSLARLWKLKEIILPSTLQEIKQLAFWDCPSLEEITIPNSCKSIGCQAFGVDLEEYVSTIFNIENRSALKMITVLSDTPIVIESDNAFNDETYENAILYVPKGAKANYQQAYGWCKFQHIVEMIEKEVSFSDEMEENTNLSNQVIDNIYYNVNDINGDGYDAAEQAIVLNSTTSEEQMASIQNVKMGDDALQTNYNGIIFEVPTGSGTITVDAKTKGSHVLNIQIGDAAPIQVTKSDRGTVVVPYQVTAPTYVYLYASSSAAAFAPVMTRASKRANAAENSLLLYGYRLDIRNILGDVNGNGSVDIGDAVSIVNYLVGKESSNFVAKAADTNKNGQIDIGDAVTIVNLLVGKITSFTREVNIIWDEKEPE